MRRTGKKAEKVGLAVLRETTTIATPKFTEWLVLSAVGRLGLEASEGADSLGVGSGRTVWILW